MFNGLDSPLSIIYARAYSHGLSRKYFYHLRHLVSDGLIPLNENCYIIFLWTSKPFTAIAAIGRDGQTYSHAPQPIHFSASTKGCLMSFSASDTSFREMAYCGHILWQAVQGSLSLLIIQRSRVIEAKPRRMSGFSFTLKAWIAPAGQSSPHLLQLGRQ